MLDENQANACRDRAVAMPLVVGWFWRHRQRLAQVGMGHLLYATCNWFFDNILYILEN